MTTPKEPGWYWAIHNEGKQWCPLQVRDYEAYGGLHVEYCDTNEQGDYPLAEFIADGWSFGARIPAPDEPASPEPGRDETQPPPGVRVFQRPFVPGWGYRLTLDGEEWSHETEAEATAAAWADMRSLGYAPPDEAAIRRQVEDDRGDEIWRSLIGVWNSDARPTELKSLATRIRKGDYPRKPAGIPGYNCRCDDPFAKVCPDHPRKPAGEGA